MGWGSVQLGYNCEMAARFKSSRRFRVGTSGWNYAHWRGVFYPQGLSTARWFEHYAQHFDTVEINNTFYQLPPLQTFESWRRHAPPGFVYAVKANRFLTHRKRLRDCREPLQAFLERTAALGRHLGPVLYQLPPHWRCNLERLEAFCTLLPRGMVHVFEFRDPRWLMEETFALLRRYGASLCWHDLTEDHPRVVMGKVIYVRFHGAGELYGGCYSEQTLRRWARWLCAAAGPRRKVYAYFNNDAGAFAVANALRLRELLVRYARRQAARRDPE